MKQFCILNENEYKDFQEKSAQRSFMNSIEAINLKKTNGWDVEYAGVKEDGRLIAATPLTYIPVMKIYRFCHAQGGLLADYRDMETLTFFTEELKKYLSGKRVMYMLMNPCMNYVQRDAEGNQVEDGYDNSDILASLEKLGYEHQGFPTDYSAFTMISWVSAMDLKDKNEAQVVKEMDQRCRRSLNRAEKQGICVRELSPEETYKFIEMEEHTAKRRGFSMREHSFYEKQLAAYGEHAKIMLAYMDLGALCDSLGKESEKLQRDLDSVNAKLAENPESANQKKKLKAAEQALELNEKKRAEALELKEKHGSLIEMAAGFFVIYDNEAVFLYGAAYDEYKKYNASYALQFAMIRYCLEHHIPRYNFYGISGNFSKDADDYGVYEFKRGFGGIVEQFIGEFILPVRKGAYKLYRTLKKK